MVDTVGFNDKFWFDYKGHPHTEKLHTIERYTRTDLGHLSIEVTIDDPGAYAKPFTTVGQCHADARDGTSGVHLPGEQSGPAAADGSGAGSGRTVSRGGGHWKSPQSHPVTHTRRRYVPMESGGGSS